MGVRKTKRSSGSTGSSSTARIKIESSASAGENMSPGALRTLKARKARQEKRELTKNALENSNHNAEITMTNVALMDSNKPDPSNGRVPGRKLIRWSSTLDQVLLLHMEYELKRRGADIPFQAIADRFSKEKRTSGSCIQQHLAKLRIQLLDRGAWVPPLPGRGGNKKEDSRGVVRDIDANGQEYERVIEWDEDTSPILERLENELSGTRKRKSATLQKSDRNPRFAGQVKSTTSPGARNRDPNKVKVEEVDPLELVSDDDYDPSASRLKNKSKGKRTKRFMDMNDDDYSDESHNQNRAARMMEFEDFEKKYIDKKIIIFKTSSEFLAKYAKDISAGGDTSRDHHHIDGAVSPISYESQEEVEGDNSENSSENEWEGESSVGEVEYEDQSDSNYMASIGPNTSSEGSFEDFAHENQRFSIPYSSAEMYWMNNDQGNSRGNLDDSHALVSNQSTAFNSNIAFDQNMAFERNMAFEPNMTFEPNMAFDPEIAIDPDTAFNSNMAFSPDMALNPNMTLNINSVADPSVHFEPMFLNTHPTSTVNLSTSWSDPAPYGLNNPSMFQDSYGDGTNNWNSLYNATPANDMTNFSYLPMNVSSGLLQSCGNQRNNGDFPNSDGLMDSNCALMSQGNSEPTGYDSDGITDNEIAHHTHFQNNCREPMNKGDQYGRNFGQEDHASNALPKILYPSP